MTLKPEVLAAMDKLDAVPEASCDGLQIIRAELLAMDARLGEAEGLFRDQRTYGVTEDIYDRITAYLHGGAGK